MSANENAPGLRALSASVRGLSLLFAPSGVTLPGAQTAAFGPPAPGVEAAESPDGTLREWTDGSVDTVLGLWALERCLDPMACLRTWRRVLRESGRLVLAMRSARGTRIAEQRQAFTPGYLVGLLNAVGGFQVRSLEELPDEAGYVVWAERLAVAEVRMPLGSLAPALAARARELPAVRAELCFQLGTMLLQTGEAGLAERCLERARECEPASPEVLFALGMSRLAQGRAGDAVTELQRAQALRPDDRDLQRWIEAARSAQGTAAAGCGLPV